MVLKANSEINDLWDEADYTMAKVVRVKRIKINSAINHRQIFHSPLRIKDYRVHIKKANAK